MHFNIFLVQFVSRWGCNNAFTQHAYGALLQRFNDDAVVLTHGQGSNFGLIAVATAPDRVRAVISFDPSGAHDPAQQDAHRLRDVPHLFVWGDYLDQHSLWVHSQPRVECSRGALDDAGCDVTLIELPALEIKGNSQALKADDSSDAVATIVLDWLQQRGLASRSGATPSPNIGR